MVVCGSSGKREYEALLILLAGFGRVRSSVGHLHALRLLSELQLCSTVN